MQIKTFIANFFREGTRESMTRLQLFVAFNASVFISLLSIWVFYKTGKNIILECLAVSGMYMGVSTTGKVVQKVKENATIEDNEK